MNKSLVIQLTIEQFTRLIATLKGTFLTSVVDVGEEHDGDHFEMGSRFKSKNGNDNPFQTRSKKGPNQRLNSGPYGRFVC